MAQTAPFPPVFPLCGVLYGPDAPLERALDWAQTHWGSEPLISPPYPFTATTYYAPEMGSSLQRQFWVFPRLVDPAGLAVWKEASNRMEQLLLQGGGRQINLDPGTLGPSALVMATAKNHAHRIPLQNGIYAHLELLFHRRGPQILPWTYPDFSAPTYHAFLMEARATLLQTIQQEARRP